MYHLVLKNQEEPLCGEYDPIFDVLVTEEEAKDPTGRHFNCSKCDYVLHEGKRHVEPPS